MMQKSFIAAQRRVGYIFNQNDEERYRFFTSAFPRVCAARTAIYAGIVPGLYAAVFKQVTGEEGVMVAITPLFYSGYLTAESSQRSRRGAQSLSGDCLSRNYNYFSFQLLILATLQISVFYALTRTQISAASAVKINHAILLLKTSFS
jgi:hypothetical protein